MKKIILIFVFLTSFSVCFAQLNSEANNSLINAKNTELIYADNFENGLQNWLVEFEQPETSSIHIKNGKLDVRTSRGATIWFKEKLSGNILISYTVKVIDSGGKNDRVSDLNAFWMASDPNNKNLFIRKGKFSEYDNLNLYYVGVGGNNNTTTRFRKYKAGTEKPVLKEYTDREHLLVGNKEYHVRIEVENGRTHYFLNDILFFELDDKTPYNEGFFGFRTTQSHQQFSDFKIKRIN